MNDQPAQRFHGVWTALITPFQPSGSGIDEKTYRNLIERQIQAKVSAIVVAGSTGEGLTLTRPEWEEASKIAMSYREQIHICISCGSSSTLESSERAKFAAGLGVHSLLVSTPAYNKPTQSGLVAHYERISQSAGSVPIMVYNIPGRSAVSIHTETMRELWKIPNIVALKESSGSWNQFLDFLFDLPEDKFLFCGDDPFNIAAVTHGASGTVSVLSNVAPAQVVGMVEAARFGRMAEALELFDATYELTKLLFAESNPIPTKWAVGQILKMDLKPRLPLLPLSEKWHRDIDRHLKELGLLRL